MSHFYGAVEGSSKTAATRRGGRVGGLVTHAAGWKGAIKVNVYHDVTAGVDRYTVRLKPWHGSGGKETVIAEGVLDANVDPAVAPGTR